MRTRLRANLLIFAALTLYSVFGDAYLRPVLREWGIDGHSNYLLAALVEVLATLPFAVLVWRGASGAYSLARLPPSAVFATLYTAPYTGLLVLVLHAGRSIPVIGSPVGVGVFTVLAWSYMFRFVARGRHAHVRRVILLDDLNDADALISECRRELRDPSLSADERAAVELNLAGALVSASLGDRANGLPEAYRIVERSMSCGAPERTFLSAVLLAQAMSAGATRSGDDEGYEDALRLVLDAAGNASSVRPEAPSEARAVRAAGLMTRSRLAESEGDGERAERLYRDAVADLERALATSPEDSGVHAQHTVALASIRGGRAAGGDLDDAIGTCRRALRRLWLVGHPWQRWEGYLALADLLARRAELEPDGGLGGFMTSLWPGRPTTGFLGTLWPQRATHDLLRASWLCMRVRGELAPVARSRIPRLTDLLRTGELAHVPWRPATIGRMHERVVSSQSVVDDDAAMLLVLRFFARLRSGVVPARALAEAQAWLRCATNDEIHHAFPKAYPVPAHRAGDALASWSERQRFTDPHNWAAFIYSGH